MATRSAKIDQKADLIWAIADKLREICTAETEREACDNRRKVW